MAQDISKKDLQALIDVVKDQNRRINSLEKQVKTLRSMSFEHEEIEEEEEKPKRIEKEHKTKEWNISPTTIITSIGIIGIVISLISFFMYAIANNWIGPTAQIMIGAILGLVLFALGFKLYDSHTKWATTIFGGSIFIELLSISFGVLYYKIINPWFAFFMIIVFLGIGLFLAIRYDSLILAYFVIIGGFLTPSITKIYTNEIFTAIYILILSISLMLLSYHKNWASLRFVSYIYVVSYEFALFNSFNKTITYGLNPVTSLIFLTLFFIIYNASSITFSLKSKEEIFTLDIFLLNLNTFFSTVLLTKILLYGNFIDKKFYGMILLMTSFFFLIDIAFIKKSYKNENINAILYSLLSSGIIIINIGLIMIFLEGGWIRLILLALPQWILYTYLSKNTKDEIYYYVFSKIFLFLITIWWMVYMFGLPSDIEEVTFVIVIMIIFLLSCYIFVMKDIDRKVNGFLLVIFGYFFGYSFSKYLNQVFRISSDVTAIILSIIWLTYTLILYIKTREHKAEGLKITAIILLIITLAKIAFFDITRLEGVVRIIGFFIFGILLLVGGYLLKKN